VSETQIHRRKRGGVLGFFSRHKQAVAITVLVVGTAAYAAYAFWPEKSTVTYVTSTAEAGTLTVAVSATGNTVAAKSSTVDPGISGTVASLKVGLGDSVKKGQVLFTVTNDDLDAAVDRAYSSYVQAKGQVEQAELTLAQAEQDLYNLQHPSASTSTNTGGGQQQTASSDPTEADIAIAEQKVVVAENGISSAKANRTSAQAAYEQAKDTADQRTVIAPIAGVVTSLNIQQGDQLGVSSASSGGGTNSSSGSSSPMVITNLKSLRAEVSVNEVDYPNLKVGQKANVTFDAISGLSITGKVAAIDQVGTNTQGVVTYNVRISFDVQDARLRPGMTCSASITTAVKPDVVLVPNAAVKSNASSSYVLVLAANSTTPQQVTVEVGDANDTYTEITSGVTAGQKVVTQTIQPGSTSSASSTPGSSRGGIGGAGMMLGGGPGGPDGD
jgi:macrolide-specific efflux system membrane fusion protein